MKKLILIFNLFLIFVSVNTALAFECSDFPSAKEIEVTVFASISKTGDVFRYDYKLNSSAKSKQNVEDFLVEHFSDVNSILSPSGWNGNISGALVSSQPVFWESERSEFNVKPKASLGGFSFTSVGLPSILLYYAHGWFELPSVPEGEAPEQPCPEQNILINAFKGKTIGPKAPPSEFKPIEFLNYIIDLKHQALSLGWITNKGIENSLDQKLDNAKKKIEQGNITPAKNMLNAFINEVEAQNGKHITSEAYGLLKYNAQYLIDKLK